MWTYISTYRATLHLYSVDLPLNAYFSSIFTIFQFEDRHALNCILQKLISKYLCMLRLPRDLLPMDFSIRRDNISRIAPWHIHCDWSCWRIFFSTFFSYQKAMQLCAWIVILLHVVPLALTCLPDTPKSPNTSDCSTLGSSRPSCCKPGLHCKLSSCWVRCDLSQRRCLGCCHKPFYCGAGDCNCPAQNGRQFY